MNPAEFAQWRNEMRAHAETLAASTRAQLAALPQFYSLEDLQRRYALGRDAMRVVLAQHCGYVGERGKPTRIHLDQVLKLDALLREAAHA
jgi:hypothetical protein